jgi:hypothetical protein
MCYSPELLEVAAAYAELQISSRMNQKYSHVAVPRVLAFVVVLFVIMKNFEAWCTGALGPSPFYLIYTDC